MAMLVMTFICTFPVLLNAAGNEDDPITDQVKSGLAADPTVGKQQIRVNTNKGRVLLDGVVESEGAKRKAGEIAINTEKVKSVQNNLIFPEQTASPDPSQDGSITDQVKSALAADPSVGKQQIRVNTNKGRVLLDGVVESEGAKRKAGEIAINTEKVKS
ncbi:BON domain-containing protein, partial [Nitrospira sp. NS4]|uniref:BON domain-containing protein n=1 Tax=Nitrospira sp. NS4 TaxID=3414498 RepID=UPI003C2DE462